MMDQGTENNEALKFGENLVRLRKSGGISQKELAERLSISQRMLSHYEHKATCIPLEIIPKIAEVLGVSIDRLFRTAIQMHPEEVDLSNLDLRIIKTIKTMLNLQPKDKRHIFSMIRLFNDVSDIKGSDETSPDKKLEVSVRQIPQKEQTVPEPKQTVPINRKNSGTPPPPVTVKKSVEKKKRRRRGTVKTYVGKNQLSELLANERLTITDIAKKLKTDPDTVRRYIHKYNL